MADVLGFGLTVLGLGLLIFGIGATMGWSWAVKSLEVAPPPWIAGVMLGAGTAFVAGAVISANWLLAIGMALLFAIIVGGMLRIGPFRAPSRRR